MWRWFMSCFSFVKCLFFFFLIVSFSASGEFPSFLFFFCYLFLSFFHFFSFHLLKRTVFTFFFFFSLVLFIPPRKSSQHNRFHLSHSELSLKGTKGFSWSKSSQNLRCGTHHDQRFTG